MRHASTHNTDTHTHDIDIPNDEHNECVTTVLLREDREADTEKERLLSESSHVFILLATSRLVRRGPNNAIDRGSCGTHQQSNAMRQS